MQRGLFRNGNLPVIIVRVVVAVPLHFISAIVVIQVIIQINIVALTSKIITIAFLKVLFTSGFRPFLLAFFQRRIDFKLLFYPGI